MHKKLLAFDLGAESGRGVLGLFDGQAPSASRSSTASPTAPCARSTRCTGTCCASTARCCTACASAPAEHGGVDSVGVDTWGVDFALLGRDGTLLGNPRHYRDPHTEGVMEAAFARVPRPEIFRQTGIQFMRFNTLFQLLALQRDRSPLLDVGRDAAVHPRPVPLLLHRHQGQRVHRRQHQPDARPGRRAAGRYDLVAALRPAGRRSSARSSSRARCSARCGRRSRRTPG